MDSNAGNTTEDGRGTDDRDEGILYSNLTFSFRLVFGVFLRHVFKSFLKGRLGVITIINYTQDLGI